MLTVFRKPNKIAPSNTNKGIKMQELIEQLMTWNSYPDHSTAWSGWEYVPEGEDTLINFCEVVGVDWWGGVEFGCLQVDEGVYKVCVDGNVWTVSEEEFEIILLNLV